MRKLVFILTLSLCFAFAGEAQVKNFKDIIGKWEIVGEEMPGASLEIIDSSRIYLTYGGEKKEVRNATLNVNKSPAWFDFQIADSSGLLQVKTLVHVYGDGIMKWQLFIEEERPAYFTSAKGEMMYLRRVSSSTTVASSQ